MDAFLLLERVIIKPPIGVKKTPKKIDQKIPTLRFLPTKYANRIIIRK
jgi:hypothetical protein